MKNTNTKSIISEKEIEYIDLDEFVRRGTDDAVYIKVIGNSFEPFICEGDLLVVERTFTPLNGDLIVAQINGGWAIKEFNSERNGLYLVTANGKPKPQKIEKELVFGVVVYIVHKTRRYEMQILREVGQ